MKVILNQDVSNLGEVGDVKDVKPGYARNFLFPRSLAYPYNQKTIALFEHRKAEIEAFKAEKRSASATLRSKLEAEDLSLTFPAGANGKLYGAVTNQTIADELLKKGISVDRKKIEVPGRAIKTVGNYKIGVRLYENEEATVKLVIVGQEVKSERKTEEKPKRAPRRHHDEEEQDASHEDSGSAPSAEEQA